MADGTSEGLSGGVHKARRALGRVARRIVPPFAMAGTLLTLGVFAWPDAVGQGEVTNTAGIATRETSLQTETTVDVQNTGKAAKIVDEQKTGPIETTVPEPTTTTVAPTCFELIFRDDFDGETLDPAWTVYDSKGNHSPHAVRRREAVSLVDGKLVITAENDDAGVAASGGMKLEYPQVYGRYSFRVRTDPDLSNATSGVILTWPVSEDQSLDGENNVYETLPSPGNRTPFYSFIHEPFDEKADGISQTEFVHHGDATEWQELSMDWTPEYLEVSWVDPVTGRLKGKRLTETQRDLITDAEHFLAIQLDLFKGAFPDDRQVKMEVDWVEVYAYCE